MGRLHPNRQFLDVQLANGYAHSQHSRNLSSVAPALPPASREDSTRVQLQKQRLTEQHHAVVVSQKIPGFKTSAAFFASLRTNLRLSASPPSSPISTPASTRGSVSPLPPPSPLATPLGTPMDPPLDQTDAVPSEDPLAGVPELNSYVTDDEAEKIAAVRLVADGVAQMRQSANNALIFHPLNMAITVAAISLLARYVQEARRDSVTTATTCSGLFMICLALVRYFTQAYIVAAEQINLDWLGNADVILTKFGDEIIGTVILDWISDESRPRRKKAWRGEIKGWAVRLKYRRKGVGTALLEDAVKIFRQKGAETLEFAEDHANSKRVLPKFYSGRFDKDERKGRELLHDLLEASPAKAKRKRGGST